MILSSSIRKVIRQLRVTCRRNRAGVLPNAISYRHTLHFVRAFWISAWFASPGVLPKRLQALFNELPLLLLPPRRNRAYPRAVKIKMSNYARNRPRPQNNGLN